MKFSLITATYGRTAEVRMLLESLTRQTYKDFELILVDQNPHFELRDLTEEYASRLDIRYVRSEVKGLSYNRNIGLDLCQVQVVAFPDDDCFYDDDVLERVVKVFRQEKGTVLVATPVKDVTGDAVWRTFSKERISRRDTLKCCCSINIFLRITSSRFDVRLGVGSRWGSGEESDYLWQVMKPGDRGTFLRDVYVHHPYIADVFSNLPKAYAYGLGWGALFKKEVVRGYGGAFSLYLYYLLRSLGGCLLSRHRAYYWQTLRGRVAGYCSFKS